MEKAKLILPQIVDLKKETDQGLINVPEIHRILNLLLNEAYNLRAELLTELHAENNKLLNEIRRKST